MACPDESDLQAYLLHELEDAEAIEAHLAGCGTCRAVVALWASVGVGVELETSPEWMPLLDRFEDLRRVGAGAFGVVYEAHDRLLDRKVAIKVVAGRDTLVEEGRALGRVNHPNVVTVHEVEQVAGGLVLVMELVRGKTLGSWARSVSWRDVTQAFVAIGYGLAAVHAAGLVHRDIKPDNIIVAEDGQPRIVDFGLARTTEDGASKRGGTPIYMAPEQLAGGEASERSDQFSFCVALFETVCGRRPFRGATETALLESMRTGVGVVPRGPRWLARILRRGLAFESGERFGSVLELVRALERGLGRRRRSVLAIAVTSVVATVGLSTWYGATQAAAPGPCEGAAESLAWAWDPARSERMRSAVVATNVSYAPSVWDWAGPQIRAYAEAWTAAHTEICEATAVRHEQSQALLDARMACLRRAATGLDAAATVLEDADAQTVGRVHRLLAGLPPPTRCVDADIDDAPPPEDAAAAEPIRQQLARARALSDAGRDAAAEALLAELEQVGDEATLAEVALVEGRLLERLGKYDDAEASLRRALLLASKSRQWELSGDAAADLMFVVGARQARPAEALRYRELAQGHVGSDALREARFSRSLGAALLGAGQSVEGKVLMERTVTLLESVHGPGHPAVALARTNLGSALGSVGDAAGAKREHARALEDLEVAFGPGHPDVALARTNFAEALREAGEVKEAERQHRLALAEWEAATGPDSPDVALAHSNIASSLVGQGRHAEARTEARLALEIRERTLGDDHVAVAHSKWLIAAISEAQGEHEMALALFTEVRDSLSQALSADHPQVMTVRDNLATTLLSLGRYDEAAAELRDVLAYRARVLGADHPDVALTRSNLANALYRQGDLDAAQTEHRAAVVVLTDSPGYEAHATRARANLANLLHARGDLAEARVEFEEALRSAESLYEPDAPVLAAMRRNYAELLLAQQDTEESQRLAELAWQHIGSRSPEERGEAAFLLARTLVMTRPLTSQTRQRALHLAEQATSLLEAAGDPHGKLTEVAAWQSRFAD